MKKILSTVILVFFAFAQTSVYAQGVSYPAYNLNTIEYRSAREDAMVGAIFEAEYKKEQADKNNEHIKSLKAPMVGKREKEIIKRYKLKKKKKFENNSDLRQYTPAEKNKSRKIKAKRNAPRNADFGSGIAKNVNKHIYPFKISGDYQASWGYDWGDADTEGRGSMWKNADYGRAVMAYAQGLDSQYMFGINRANTYDKMVFDRFRFKLETVNNKGLNFLSEMVVDPWSFVGQTDYFMMTSRDGQQVPVRLRYWSNTQSTIDERVWLTSGQDFLNIPQIKVYDGKTRPVSAVSRWNNRIFDIPAMEINRDFRPLRKLEAGYKSDNLDFKVFPLADQARAYTSDDPLILSNKHIYWEPSPWLDRWEPALYFPGTGDFRRGIWSNSISNESRDSDNSFLTLLRGLSFEIDNGDTYIGGGTAMPLTLWQDYDSVNSLPGAVRFKQRFLDNYYVGAVYAYNYGFNEQRVDAFNHVIGIDAGYEIDDLFTIRGEYAYSVDRTDWHGHEPEISRSKAEGTAARIEAKGEFLKDKAGNSMLKISTGFTHMGDNFRDRLSNYRNTRSDQFWGKHINFNPVSPDYNAVRIGDGMDIGRNVYNIRIENILYQGVLESLFDARFVRGDSGGQIENVYREEATVRPFSNLTGKLLLRYQDMPRTTLNRDSYIITDYISQDNTDEFLQNNNITEGANASVWTWSLGLHYDPVKWLGFESIYERTNDHGIFPQDTLVDAGFRDLGNVRELNYFLYGQPLIAVPPYDPYDIYKARVFYTPFENLRTKFEYVINTFKHATGLDDNISHYGVEMDMDIAKGLRASFKFVRCQLVDLFRQQQRGEDLPFYHHNNIFAKLEYDICKDQTFVVQFGEFFIPPELSPVPWILSTVDTQRIVRFYLKGKF